jgi:RNA polymerase sigma-70 factor (ECF subfamily)
MTAPQPPNAAADQFADAALVARAQRGDVGAFEVIYRREVGRVYAVCLRMSGDPQRARELTQSVFVRAWDRIGSFRGDALLSSWLHRIAVNELLTEVRSERRRRARVGLVEDEGNKSEADALERAGFTPPDDAETRIDLERAIAALPAGARTVFVLHDIEGYRHTEIARMTGSAEGTLRAQLHRARRLLMEALSR